MSCRLLSPVWGVTSLQYPVPLGRVIVSLAAHRRPRRRAHCLGAKTFKMHNGWSLTRLWSQTWEKLVTTWAPCQLLCCFVLQTATSRMVRFHSSVRECRVGGWSSNESIDLTRALGRAIFHCKEAIVIGRDAFREGNFDKTRPIYQQFFRSLNVDNIAKARCKAFPHALTIANQAAAVFERMMKFVEDPDSIDITFHAGTYHLSEPTWVWVTRWQRRVWCIKDLSVQGAFDETGNYNDLSKHAILDPDTILLQTRRPGIVGMTEINGTVGELHYQGGRRIFLDPDIFREPHNMAPFCFFDENSRWHNTLATGDHWLSLVTSAPMTVFHELTHSVLVGQGPDDNREYSRLPTSLLPGTNLYSSTRFGHPWRGHVSTCSVSE